MQAQSSLSLEQKSVLRTTFMLLESMRVYLASVAPIADETDQQMLKGILELAETCLQNLAQYFLIELLDLAEDRKKRSGL